MFEAQYLFGGDVVFSPWIRRSGTNAQIRLDFIENSVEMGSDLTVDVYEKNSEDTGDGTSAAGGSAITKTAPDVYSSTFTGVKELIRYRFSYGSDSNPDRYALFRMLPILWFEDVGA